ncbi:ferritin [Chlorobium phaeobacteroides]|uniref:ferritin n=1 Tax=Chlorobium phaeobacteroides TaxID=1096 RepID=UPI0000534910|nr:ferritin [Chlorobium phaeobacteroides]
MLSRTILEKLNKQVNLEAYSAHLYLQMSAWLLSQSLDNTALFFRQHAEEEKVHMMKLFDYINETGSLALIGSIEAPRKTGFASLIALLDDAWQHECAITECINKLVETAFEEKV